MTRDASLDDFLDGSGASADDDSADAQSEHEQVPSNGETVVPVTTGSWHPDSRACDVCGTSVRRRWRDDDGLVCADCKSW